MKMTKKISLVWIVSILMSMLFLECSTPLSRYPNFLNQKLNMKRTLLMADVLVIEDVLNDSNTVNVMMNRAMGDSVLWIFSEKLRQGGYHIDDSIFTSVGLTANQRRSYKVIRTEEDQHISPELLPMAVSPFFLHEKYQQDSLLKQSLTSVYKSLLLTSSESEAEHTIIQDASLLGQRSGVNTLFIVFIGGFNVAPTRQYAEEFSTNNHPSGNVSLEHISQVTAMFYIVDVESGELIWHDRAFVRGGTVHKEKILRMAENIINRLP